MRDTIAFPAYYTVIGIKVETYESTIEYEKHFRDLDHAKEYAADLQRNGLVAVIAAL